jgi:hypothetical protein
MLSAVGAYASWGFFDPGKSDYRDGYQCPPVNWGINTPRKKAFFGLLKIVTGAGVSEHWHIPCRLVSGGSRVHGVRFAGTDNGNRDRLLGGNYLDHPPFNQLTGSVLCLLAEDVILSVRNHRPEARRNADLLNYVEFSARRLDVLGQKAIYSKEIADRYSQSRANAGSSNTGSRSLRRIRGPMQDLMHKTFQLRREYENLWWGENGLSHHAHTSAADQIRQRCKLEGTSWHKPNLLSPKVSMEDVGVNHQEKERRWT